jgi:hypothetical protein
MNRIKERLKSIQEKMLQIRKSGEIAPDFTWIQKFYVPKNGKRYEYYRLMKAVERKSITGKIQGKVEKYLGKLGSALYKRFKAAIARRNELKKLERMYQRLLLQCSEEVVSQGKGRGSRERGTGNRQIKPKLTTLLWEAIARIENNQIQIWKWLKVMGEKLGIEMPEARSKDALEETMAVATS